MRRRILVIEDDDELAGMLKVQLEVAGFEVVVVHTGFDGLTEVRSRPPDVVLLDFGLPDMEGLEVCRWIRGEGNRVPIIILADRDSEIDRIVAYELGADDCINKPFSSRELLARIKALLRRIAYFAGQKNGEHDRILRAGPLSIDLDKRKVILDRRQINLTEKEFDLLTCLAKYPGKVFSRRELLHQVWGYRSDCYEHTVDSHVNRLRAKLETNRTTSAYVMTVWGIGYKFREFDGSP